MLVKGSRANRLERVAAALGAGVARRRPLACCATSPSWLAQYYSGFNVFSYLTLRAILAALTALVISFLVGPGMIRKLAEHQVGQRVRSDGPQTHLTKAGTPTMGGALILVAIVVGDAAVGRPRQPLRVDHARASRWPSA